MGPEDADDRADDDHSADGEDDLHSFDAEMDAPSGPTENLQEWFLVDGDRLAVATLLSVGVFVLLVVLNALGVVAFVNEDSVTRMASGMTAGTLSLVTLVVSINQLILSYEFTSVSEFRDRFSSIMDLRRDIEERTAVAASPAEPTALLELLLTAVRDHASSLPDTVADLEDEEVRDLVVGYADEVTESAVQLDERLDEKGFGTFDALSAALSYRDGWQIYAARQLQNRYAETLPEEAREELAALVDTLELFNVAEENFKTTYLQRELTQFSQLTVAMGLPSVVAAIVLGFLYADLDGSAIPEAFLPLVTPALTAVVVAPLMLLAAFILRTATVSRRTASVGPLQPEKDQSGGPFDATYGEESDTRSAE